MYMFRQNTDNSIITLGNGLGNTGKHAPEIRETFGKHFRTNCTRIVSNRVEIISGRPLAIKSLPPNYLIIKLFSSILQRSLRRGDAGNGYAEG